MKAEELMIGDWVLLRGQLPMKVVTPKGNQRGDVVLQAKCSEEFLICPADQISAIPLTEGVLRDNGFKREEQKHYSLAINRNVSFDYNFDHHHVQVWVCDIDLKLDVEYICYVHQLQHAMRLAEVEKDIEL